MTSQPVWARLEHRGAPPRVACCAPGALPDARAAGGHQGFPDALAARRPLALPDELLGEEDEAANNGLDVDEPHGLLLAGLPEEALARPEHDREDDQPHLVDQVMLDQRAPELIAGRDDDFSVELLLQLRDLLHHIALRAVVLF
jgi:hypothetical protein